MGLLNDDDDDTDLSHYNEMSAESDYDYELSDDQQSPGDCEISDSEEEDSSHGSQAISTTACLSVADAFTCSEDSNSDV